MYCTYISYMQVHNIPTQFVTQLRKIVLQFSSSHGFEYTFNFGCATSHLPALQRHSGNLYTNISSAVCLHEYLPSSDCLRTQAKTVQVWNFRENNQPNREAKASYNGLGLALNENLENFTICFRYKIFFFNKGGSGIDIFRYVPSKVSKSAIRKY